MFLAIAACATLVSPWGEEVLHTTRHYEVRVEGTQEEAQELGRVLESARAQLADAFRAKPKRSKELTRLYLMRDREAWLARIRNAGVAPPSAADLVHYAPEIDAIYVYSEGTPSQQRALVLHGAVQQFHCQCKPKNRDLVRTWLAMGLADHFSLNVWNGEELQLGAQPVVSNHDVLGRARELLQPENLAPEDLYEMGLAQGEISMALTRYLMDHAGAKRKKQFDKLALGFRGSKLMPSTYAKVLGDPAKLAGEILNWLDGHPQPMRALSAGWEDLGDGTLRCSAKGDVGEALLKVAPSELSVLVTPDPEGSSFAGLVFGGDEEGDRWRMSVLPGEILVRGVKADGSGYERSFPLDSGGRPVELVFRRDGADVLLFADKTQIGAHELETPAVGLFAEDGVVDFVDLRWN